MGAVETMTPMQMASLLDKASLVERRVEVRRPQSLNRRAAKYGDEALDLRHLTNAELDVFQDFGP